MIKRLSDYPKNMQVMILDGFNGGGFPREINLGPFDRKIKKIDAEEVADCEEIIGKKVVVMGYGCY